MSRHLTLLLCTLVVIAGCSRNPERSSAAAPTAPSVAASAPEPGSLLGNSSVAPGGISGKFDVSFPPRNESFDMYTQLETKYRNGLGRALAPTFVDAEGVVVWTQEYLRYRTNGCDHATSTQRVMSQINGLPAGGVCGAPPDGLVQFGPRQETLDFRRMLETRYQQFGRGATQSAVDAEGSVVWTQEYLRYRVNSCDHPTSVQKVFSQIDGGGVSPTCFVPPCAFTVSPQSHSVPPSGGTFTITVTRTPGAAETCIYGAESLSSFISITDVGTTTGGTVTYTVPPNTGPARSGQIRVRWQNGSTLVDVNQGGSFLNATILLVDPAQSTGPTTVCQIKTTSTQCQVIANANLSGPSTFAWTVTYNYNGVVTRTQANSSNVFAFTETCGQPGSSAGGTDSSMNVTLTVTDPNNVSETTTAAFTIRLFTC